MLDDFDRSILKFVQQNNQLTHGEIGKLVNLSASSVRRRLTSMRRNGIIKADVCIVDVGQVMVEVVVRVTFQQESQRIYNEFKQQMLESPEVSQCYSVSGEIDFILIVQVPDLASYESWGERVLMANPAIRRYDSNIVWSRVKYSTAIAM